MFVVGDVTDKGIPAALVMASTHALLRDAAPRLISPGKVLGHVNEMLCVDIPAHMFVTCLALVLDPVRDRWSSPTPPRRAVRKNPGRRTRN